MLAHHASGETMEPVVIPEQSNGKKLANQN